MPKVCPDKLKVALYEACERVTESLVEKAEKSPSYLLDKIPQGRAVEPSDNSDVLIYGTARQASAAYRDANFRPRTDLVEGAMTGRDNATERSAEYTVDINDIDDGACNTGRCTFNFSQGFRRRNSRDREFELESEIICAKDLERFPRETAMEYLTNFMTSFKEYTYQVWEDEIMNMAIASSEANGSVLSSDNLHLSTAGWVAPPVYRMSIHYLREYRQYLITQNAIPEDAMLEIEVPSQDWIDMVREDQIRRGGGAGSLNININVDLMDDSEGRMRGRKMHVYDGIKAYFNEKPIRGFFKQTGVSGGQPRFNFVRVYCWTNVAGEEGGLVQRPNQDYNKSEIVVNGATYPMVNLIPVINRKSFSRHSLGGSYRPSGSGKTGTNSIPHDFSVHLLDGAFIPCNDFNDKFKLVGRNRYRFRSVYPEYSGFLAYRHTRPCGYVLDVCTPDIMANPDSLASGMNLAACSEPYCECDDITPVDGLIRLEPCGTVNTVFTGESHTVTFNVYRDNGSDSAVGVTYTFAAGTGTEGTHWSGTDGTLSWADGENDVKTVTATVLAGSGYEDDTVTFTLTLSSATGGATLGCAVATVVIDDASPTVEEGSYEA